VTPGLPTPGTKLRARYVTLLVWCKGGCQHQAEADLHRLVESGRGDAPLIHLRFRCSNCGSDRTDFVVALTPGAAATRPGETYHVAARPVTRCRGCGAAARRAPG
jgi:hypothetical protein